MNSMSPVFRLKKTFVFLLALSLILSLFTAFKSHMNNWLIFRASFDHLMQGVSLYVLYPQEHHDLYKYSPTFALFMAPFAYLPFWLGATLWNLLGALLFALALVQMPITDSQRKAVLWISLPEFIGSTQGFQSNIHMVALLMLFWVSLENKQSLSGALALWSSFFIKIFGICAGCLYLYSEYTWKTPRNLLKNAAALFGVGLFLFALPAFFVGWDSLLFQYMEWGRLLKMDADQSYGFSLMGVIHAFSGWEFNRTPIQLAGALGLVASILYFRNTDQKGRMQGLIALCYFLILFNHKTESPTFIIAMMAFGLHQSLINNKTLRWGLIVFTLGCVSLMYADPFRSMRSTLDFYCVKAWPFLILYPMSLFHWGTQNSKIIETKSP